MKLLVCGGRDYDDYWRVNDVLSRHSPADAIIHGGARGADTLAGRWARENGIQEVICPANWDFHGKRAGYVRNSAMSLLLDPAKDKAIVFPGGKGTAMMEKIAMDLGVTVVRVWR